MGRSSVGSEQKNMLKESNFNKIYNKCETYQEVLDFISRKIQENGWGSLLQFAVQLKNADPKKTHRINKETLRSIFAPLQQDHLDLIFQELSEDRISLDYSVLVYDLKGEVEEERMR